jgi:Tetratricopeptide repeat
MTRQRRSQKYAGRIICSAFAALLLLKGFGQTRKGVSDAKPQTNQGIAAQLPATPNHDGYVGSASCSPCHLGIYRQFSRTSMGHSMSQITPELVQTLPTSTDLYDNQLDRHFEVHARDGKLYQSEYQTDAAGKEIFSDTHALDWIIGAGANGFGALLQHDNYLFQAPLSFYSKPGKWGPSPGYEFGDYGFNRPILAGCISCHSGRSRPVASTNGRFESPPFTEMAIGCENCHGPGAAHIRAMESEDPPEKGHSIVNPAKLSLDLANNICMSCHQTGNVRVFKEGKTYQDFRPGTPLDDVLSILMVPPTREAAPQTDHLEHFYSMTLSKCYRASAGRMGCITCHNPHVEPSREEAPAYFNTRCLTCHTQQSCKLTLAAREHSTPADNCIGCHMPKRDVQVISHSSVTSHRILAKPDEGFPETAFHQTTPALPDLIHLNPIPGKKDDVVPPLTLLEAYGELAANKPEYIAPYLKVLAQLEQTDPDKAIVQAALGRRELKSGKLQEAADHLQRALQIGPPQATVYGDLAEATTKLGRPEEGLALLQKATALDPFNPVLQKALVVRLISMKQYSNALVAMEHYLESFPQDSYMRKMLDLAKGVPSQR